MFRLFFAAALLFAATCRADSITIYFTGLPDTFQNGSYNGYATAIVNGIPNQLLICDDYRGETSVPSPATMIYDFSTLTGNNPLQYAMWDTARLKYEEAADLLYDLSLLGSGATPTAITDYQYALWNLMDPTAPLATGRAAQEQALQAAALADVTNPSRQPFLSSAVYPGLKIYTPTQAFAGNQEFLAFAPVTIPEPATLALIACAFLGALSRLLLRRPQTEPRTK